MAGETKNSFVYRFEHLNNKTNVKFVTNIFPKGGGGGGGEGVGWGVSTAKLFKGKYKPKLEFPKGFRGRGGRGVGGGGQSDLPVWVYCYFHITH